MTSLPQTPTILPLSPESLPPSNSYHPSVSPESLPHSRSCPPSLKLLPSLPVSPESLPHSSSCPPSLKLLPSLPVSPESLPHSSSCPPSLKLLPSLRLPRVPPSLKLLPSLPQAPAIPPSLPSPSLKLLPSLPLFLPPDLPGEATEAWPAGRERGNSGVPPVTPPPTPGVADQQVCQVQPHSPRSSYNHSQAYLQLSYASMVAARPGLPTQCCVVKYAYCSKICLSCITELAILYIQYPVIIMCSLYVCISSVPPQMENVPLLILECDEEFESSKDRTKKLLKQVGSYMSCRPVLV